VGPRVGFNTVEKIKILPCRESNPGRPARSLSLYRLSYPEGKHDKAPARIITFVVVVKVKLFLYLFNWGTR
jgi:hypothetical protein